MQLKVRPLYDKGIRGAAGFFWVTGLLAAGSDGPFMPWVNLGGVFLFLMASIWLGRKLSQLEIPPREKHDLTQREQVVENFRPDYNHPCPHGPSPGGSHQYASGVILKAI